MLKYLGTYGATATTGAATAATATATTAGGGTAAMLGAAGTLCTTARALGVGLRSASKLDGNLAVKDGLAVELSDRTLCLGGRRQRDEGVSDGARGARVGGDSDGLAVQR